MTLPTHRMTKVAMTRPAAPLVVVMVAPLAVTMVARPETKVTTTDPSVTDLKSKHNDDGPCLAGTVTFLDKIWARARHSVRNTMKRRLFFQSLALGLAIGFPAFARSFSDEVISQLVTQGYSNIVMETTWLGRVRILADLSGGRREIILNPRTGEILRDLWTAADGSAGPIAIVNGQGGTSSGSNSGSDSSGDDGGTSGGDDGGTSGGDGGGTSGGDDGGTSGGNDGGTSGGDGGGTSGGDDGGSSGSDGGGTSGGDDGGTSGGNDGGTSGSDDGGGKGDQRDHLGDTRDDNGGRDGS